MQITTQSFTEINKIDSLRNALGVTNIPRYGIDKISKSIASKKHQLDIENKRNYREVNGVLIYESKHGTYEDFNGLFKDKNGDLIFCRNLAHFAAIHHIKNKHHQLNETTIPSIDVLRNNEVDSKYTEFRSRYYEFFDLVDFAAYLHKISAVLRPNEQCSLLMSSEEHTMALNFQFKFSENNQAIYLIKFYDPNRTTMHVNFVFEELAAIKSIGIDELSNAKFQYFQTFKSCVVFSPELLKSEETPYIDMYSHDLRALLFFSFTQIFMATKSVVDHVVKKIEGLDNKVDILAARDSNGYSLATYLTCAKAPFLISFYLDAVLNSNLSNEQKYELVTTKNENGVLVFIWAMDFQYATRYLDAIVNSTLTNEQKIEIFLTVDKNNHSAFVEWFNQDNSQFSNIINGIIEAIEQAGLMPEFENRLGQVNGGSACVEKIDKMVHTPNKLSELSPWEKDFYDSSPKGQLEKLAEKVPEMKFHVRPLLGKNLKETEERSHLKHKPLPTRTSKPLPVRESKEGEERSHLKHKPLPMSTNKPLPIPTKINKPLLPQHPLFEISDFGQEKFSFFQSAKVADVNKAKFPHKPLPKIADKAPVDSNDLNYSSNHLNFGSSGN